MHARLTTLSAVALAVAAACSDGAPTTPPDDARPTAAAGQAADTGRARPDTATPGAKPTPVARPDSGTGSRPDTGRVTRPDTARPPVVDTMPAGDGVLSGTVFVESSFIVQSGDSAGMRGVRMTRTAGVTVRLFRQAPADSTRSSVQLTELATAVSGADGAFTMPAQPDGMYILRAASPAGSGLLPAELFVNLRRGRPAVTPPVLFLVLRK